MENLETASTYVNNLLLARGLLRTGKPIEFAHLTGCTCKTKKTATVEKGGAVPKPPSTAPAEVINLVHDLILRRDRDQDQHESLAFTLRSLRVDAARNSTEIERLREKNADLDRQLALHTSTMTVASAAAAVAEKSARSLRDEVARLKTLLNQVKTQCANDVRKRDVQLQKLKSHLTVRQRGTGKTPTGGGLVIQPGVTGMAHTLDIGADEREEAPSVEETSYSLKQETTEFLTALSASLSEENDSLIGLLRETISSLRDLQGLHPSTASASQSHEQLVTTPPSFATLQTDLHTLLSHLTDLLTNPSFAPVEEVHTRDEEIARLREGWENMAGRWQEAVGMMAGWRQRMLRGGKNVNLEELRMGLCLGDGLGSPDGKVVERPVLPQHDEEEVESEVEDAEPDVADLPPIEDEAFVAEEPLLFADDAEAEAEEDREVEHERSFTPSDEPPLGHTSGNKAQRREQGAARRVSFHPGADANAEQENAAPDSSPLMAKPVARGYLRSTTSSLSNVTQARKKPLSLSRGSKGSTAVRRETLTVSQKLKIAETEARRMSGASSPLDLVGGATAGAQEEDGGRADSLKGAKKTTTMTKVKMELGDGGSPVKRTRITGRPRRRKSTLSPDELDELMGR